MILLGFGIREFCYVLASSFLHRGRPLHIPLPLPMPLIFFVFVLQQRFGADCYIWETFKTFEYDQICNATTPPAYRVNFLVMMVTGAVLVFLSFAPPIIFFAKASITKKNAKKLAKGRCWCICLLLHNINILANPTMSSAYRNKMPIIVVVVVVVRRETR